MEEYNPIIRVGLSPVSVFHEEKRYDICEIIDVEKDECIFSIDLNTFGSLYCKSDAGIKRVLCYYNDNKTNLNWKNRTIFDTDNGKVFRYNKDIEFIIKDIP